MKTHEKYHGARHQALILIYIGCLTLSQTPAMLAPPERSFEQGQPEMQQSMDNMGNRETIVKKRISSSSSDEDVYKEINFKTSNLLAEAENVLKNLPESKERQWMESFVVRMREIASILDKTSQHQNLPKEYHSVKGAPVLAGLPKLPTKPLASAVPEINPFQKPNTMMSKIQITSPEISTVLSYNDYHLERQAVTKPLELSSNAEEIEIDELVHELESLYKENAQPAISKNANMINQVQTVTNPAITLSTENNHGTPSNEISEFHRLGGVMPKEVIDILYADSQKLSDSAKQQDMKADEEINFTESGMKDSQGALRLDDLHNKKKEITFDNLKGMPYYVREQFHYLKFNHTLQNKHPNLAQAFPMQTGHYFQHNPPLNRAQPYQGHFQSGDKTLQKVNPYKIGKHHDLDTLHSQEPAPDASKQKLSKPQFSIHGRMPLSDYNNYFMRHNFGPYPYMHNWNSHNSTVHLPQMMSSYAINQAKIDTQLSDEMKRELRHGKIIVLSDSVVRSNFKIENKEKFTQNPESRQMDMKNETMTEN